MILTGARGLRWDEINGDTIELPASRMRNGLRFDLPITPLMASILETIPRFEGSPYVCTTNGKSSLRHWDRAKPFAYSPPASSLPLRRRNALLTRARVRLSLALPASEKKSHKHRTAARRRWVG